MAVSALPTPSQTLLRLQSDGKVFTNCFLGCSHEVLAANTGVPVLGPSLVGLFRNNGKESGVAPPLAQEKLKTLNPSPPPVVMFFSISHSV